eukprot:9914600-Alexandrium_andersonii.AAC.1
MPQLARWAMQRSPQLGTCEYRSYPMELRAPEALCRFRAAKTPIGRAGTHVLRLGPTAQLTLDKASGERA